MRQVRGVLLVLVVALLVVPTALKAAPNPSLNAKLNGFEETPAVSTTGTGEFKAKIDDGVIEFELSYANLEGTVTLFAHIHFGQRGVAGGVSAFLCGGGGKPACPATQGTVSGTITAADVIGPTGQGIAPGEFDELVRAIRSKMAYANVHTNKHPGGGGQGTDLSIRVKTSPE